jgi:hypothetical protein
MHAPWNKPNTMQLGIGMSQWGHCNLIIQIKEVNQRVIH